MHPSSSLVAFLLLVTACKSDQTDMREPPSDGYAEGVRIGNFPVPIPEAVQYGSFSSENSCLVLTLGGKRFSPVFVENDLPRNASTEASPAIVTLGQRVRIGGGAMPKSAIDPYLKPQQRGKLCLSEIFVVSKVGQIR